MHNPSTIACAVILLLAAGAPARASGEIRTGNPAPLPKALNAQELAEIRGGETTSLQTITNQNLNAVVSGNRIDAGTVESGAVNFANNALNGFNGIGNFVINTGNNNVLQGSLSVTVTGTQ